MQTRTNVGLLANVIAGTPKMREAETISQIGGRATPLPPMTVMSYDPVADEWGPLNDVNPAAAPAILTTGPCGDPVAFQAIADGEFSITVDGADIELAGLDFSDVSTPLDAPAVLTCGVNGAIIAAGWDAVADGEFRVAVNGVVHDVIGLDFAGVPVTTFAEVAEVINVATVPLGFRFVHDGIGNIFSAITTVTGQVATITLLEAVPGGVGTDISGVAGPGGFLNGAAPPAAAVPGVGGIAGVTPATIINAAAAGRFHVIYDGTQMVFVSPTTGALSAITLLGPLAVPVGTPIEGAALLNGDAAPAAVTPATGFGPTNLPAGIYVGRSIPAATLVAGDVPDSPIMVGGDVLVDLAQVVLEGGLTLDTVVPTQYTTIAGVLARQGLFPVRTRPIVNFENP